MNSAAAFNPAIFFPVIACDGFALTIGGFAVVKGDANFAVEDAQNFGGFRAAFATGSIGPLHVLADQQFDDDTILAFFPADDVTFGYDGSSCLCQFGVFRPGQVRPGQVRPGQVRPGQVRPVQVRPGQVRPVQVRPGQVRPGQVRPGQVRPVQVRPGQVRPGQVRPGQVRPVQVRPGQVRPGQVRPDRFAPDFTAAATASPRLAASQVKSSVEFQRCLISHFMLVLVFCDFCLDRRVVADESFYKVMMP